MKKISYELDIETKKSAKNIEQVKQEISGLVDEMNELNKTNQIQKEQLLALEQRYKSMPKSALLARQVIGDQMEMLNVAIKENNTALQGFRIEKQHKQKLISDLKEVEKSFGKNVDEVVEFGEALGNAAGAIILLGGGSKKTTEKLEKGLGVAMAFKSAVHGIKSGVNLYNNVLKTNNLFIAANNVVTKIAAFTMGLFSKSVKTTSFSFKALKVAIASTGIGLLVIALGEIISYFSEAEEEAGSFEDALGLLNKQFEAQIGYIGKLKAEQDLKNKQVSRELTLLNKKFDLEVAIAKKKGASEKALEAIELRRHDATRKRLVDEVGLQIPIKKQAEDLYTIKKKSLDVDKYLFSIRNDFNTEAYEQAAQLLDQKEKEFEETKKIRDTEVEKYHTLNDAVKLLDLDLQIRQNQVKVAKKLKEVEEVGIVKTRDAEFIDANELVIEETNNTLMVLSKLYGNYYKGLGKQRQKDLQEEMRIMGAKFSLQNQLVSHLSSSLSSIAQIAGEGTKVQKAAAMSDIIMRTAMGFAQGLSIAQKSAEGTGPAAVFAYPIFYASQVAAVLGATLKAKSILSKVKAGPTPNLPTGGGGGGGTAPSQPPEFNIVGQSGFNQIAGALGQQQQQPIQAFVVSGDVTTAQQLENNIIQTATF